jgi:transcriptional regulator with XRE-family HTH domain
VKRTPSSIDKYIGSRVRLRRMMLGLTQERLGDAVGVTFQQIQKYEKGTNRIGASRLQAIAKTLTVETSYFFDGLPQTQDSAGFSETKPRPVEFDFVATAEGLRLHRSFIRIKDRRVRKRIVELVTALAGPPET